MKKCFLIIVSLINIQAWGQEKLFWFIENNKIGFKNEKGVTKIKPQYVMAEPFSEGLACARTGENQFTANYGFINEKGDWIIKPQYNNHGSLSEGLANVAKDFKWGFIDKKGKWVIEPQYQLCYGFKNGYAQVSKGGKWGIIDKKGNMVIVADNYSVTNVSNGVLARKKDLKTPWELIDIKGKRLSDKTWGNVMEFGDGLAPARDENDKYGFINAKGEWVIKPQYTEADPFFEGLAAVSIDYKWGFIDKTGKLVIPAEYSSLGRFKDGIAMIEKTDEYLYINKQGKVILHFPK